MRVKDGVSLVGVIGEMFMSAIYVEEVLNSLGYDCVITSGSEGKHTSEVSLHYRGRGLDYRNRDIPAVQRKEVEEKVRIKLGPDYYVVMKADHLHTEYDPRMKGVA